MPITGNGTIKVGCCGFPVSREEYYRHFYLVEIQQTFYRLPLLQTAQRWRQEAPEGFEFTMKAWQLITHPPTSPTYRKAGLHIPPEKTDCYGFFRPTPEVREAWEKTEKFSRELGAKIILFQCPPSFQETPENIARLQAFFLSIKSSGYLFAWEPRGDWRATTVKAICRQLGLIHCTDPLEKSPLSGGPKYCRLHGGTHYRHRYTQDELERLLRSVSGGPGYVLFNNLNMYQDALAFRQLLEQERP